MRYLFAALAIAGIAFASSAQTPASCQPEYGHDPGTAQYTALYCR